MSESVYVVTSEQINQIAQQVFDMIEKRMNNSEVETLYRKRTCGKSEAARHLKVHRLTIYNMIKDGRLKANSSGKVLVQSIIDYENGLGQGEKAKVNKRGNKTYV